MQCCWPFWSGRFVFVFDDFQQSNFTKNLWLICVLVGITATAFKK